MNGQQFFRVAANDDDQYASPNTYGNDLVGQSLPLQLLSFEAKPLQRSVALQWTSANEHDFVGYELQRATAQGLDFEEMTWLPSAGDPFSTHDYGYEDRAVVPGMPYYYRLKMVDADASFSYSPVRQAILGNGGWGRPSLSPNPTREGVSVSFLSPQASIGSVRIVDSIGRQIGLVESPIVEGPNTLLVEEGKLPGGLFFLEFECDGVVRWREKGVKR